MRQPELALFVAVDGRDRDFDDALPGSRKLTEEIVRVPEAWPEPFEIKLKERASRDRREAALTVRDRVSDGQARQA